MAHATNIMAEVQSLPKVKGGDRFGITLFFAAAVHALVIFGVSFSATDKNKKPSPLPLEITLVHSKSKDTPKKADYLAQANQEGGGNVKEKMRPSSPFPNPRPVNQKRGDAPRTNRPSSPPPQTQPEKTQVMLAERPSPQKAAMEPKEPRPQLPDAPKAAELMARSREIARLSAEIRQRQQAYAKMPRHKYVTANTREYVFASYEDAWRLKVERIGNLNYPDEAKRRRLSGSLILDVAIRADGSVLSIDLVQSSGHKVLDDGAIRIVRMAAPFAPFTEEMRKETDILHVLRSWQFRSNNRFRTER